MKSNTVTPDARSVLHYLLKKRDRRAPPTFFASEPEASPRSTKPLAWLNLSHLEKAKVFVIVSTSAMTATHVLAQYLSQAKPFHLKLK